MSPARLLDRLGGPVYYGALRALGVPAVSRRIRDAGLILCYHNVVSGEASPHGEPGLHVPRERFAWQMRWLADHYTLVSLGEFADRLAAGGPLRWVAAVTFDDGYAGVFEHALPILRELRVPATVFLVARAAGRRSGFWWDRPEIVAAATPPRREAWLNDLRGDARAILARDGAASSGRLPPSYRPAPWSTVRAHRGRGVSFGVHSATHRSLPTLNDGELEYEVAASRSMLEQAVGGPCEFFAYPYGHWDARVRARLRAAGYRAAVSLDFGLNGRSADPWSLRRVSIPAGISEAGFQAWTAGVRAPGRA